MKKIIPIILVMVLLAGCRREPSRITLPSLVGDNMLLQQNSKVRIWGKAAPDRKISVSASWNADARVVSDKEGNWSVDLLTPAAGGPYKLNISAKDTSFAVNNILIGDVWVCSGQSNMEMPLEGWPPTDTIMYSASSIATANLPEIRLFNVVRRVSGEPLEECTGKWEVCTPSSVRQFSATAFFFGRKLNKETGVPVGLIESAWGGTPAEAWMSAPVLESAGEFTEILGKIKESASLMGEYQRWLESHRQLIVSAEGDAAWKNLSFGDEKIQLADYDDSKWPTMKLPSQFEASTGDFDGVVWFRKTVEIPVSLEGKELVLSIGPVDDMDRTYFNGELIGSNEITGVWQKERSYDIPKDLVKKGPNSIAVRVIDNQGGGGIYGKPGSMYISARGSKGEKLSVEGDWKFQPVAELSGSRFYILDAEKEEFYSIKRPAMIGPSTPSSLFNGMINPLLKYPLKGAIWYQGEANVGRADQYAKIFPLMIQNWRDAWGIKDFPFYFVQIAPYVYGGTDSTELAYLREAQENALQLPNTGMVNTLDITTVMNIHPPYKKEVGERLADIALSEEYGKEIRIHGPRYKSVTVEGKTVKVAFDNAEGGLVAKDGKLNEFEIAAADGKYFRADARIVNSEVWLSSPKVDAPVSARYCWRNGSTASLFSSEGLPALQFRSK